MCNAEFLGKYGQLFSLIYFFAGAILMIVGNNVQTAHLHALGWGDVVVHVGGAFMAVGFVIMVAGFLACYGQRNHNKFILVVVMGTVLFLILMQAVVASVLINTLITDPVDSVYQQHCMLGLRNTTGCDTKFLGDPLRKKLQTMWARMEEESLGESDEFRNLDSGVPKPVKKTYEMYGLCWLHGVAVCVQHIGEHCVYVGGCQAAIAGCVLRRTYCVCRRWYNRVPYRIDEAAYISLGP